MNVTSIIDYSSTHLEIINDGKTLYIKKAYIEVAINPNDSRIVDMFWHWYEYNDHQRLFYLDFAIVTTPVAGNAAALLVLIQGYLVSQFAAPNPESYEYYLRTGTTRKRYDIGTANGAINSGNALAIPANRMTCAWRYYSKPRVIGEEAIYVITAGTAAARATVYIYSNVNAYPSAKLHTFTEHNTSATTKKENTGLSVALPAGAYWFIVHVNEAITIPGIDAYAAMHPMGVTEPSNGDFRLQLFTGTYAYGAAPATFAETDFSFGTAIFPIIGLILI